MINAAQNIGQAINAYKTAADSFSIPVKESNAPSEGENFSTLVKGAIQEAVRIGERSEQLSIAGVNDKADLTQVITAVAEAEIALETVVKVRDKVIDAYLRIMRMPM